MTLFSAIAAGGADAACNAQPVIQETRTRGRHSGDSRSYSTMTFHSAEFRLASKGGLRACARWRRRGAECGVVQIAHGMDEHIGRYIVTIEALTSADLTVDANDHRVSNPG
jgi:hypothetical protein